MPDPPPQILKERQQPDSRLARIQLAIWSLALFSCFSGSLNLAEQINERLYIIVMYGWKTMSKEGLHLTRTKPILVVSNGDRAPEFHGFILFVTVLVLGIALFAYGLKFMSILTSLMGRSIDVLKLKPTINEVDVGAASGRPMNISEMMVFAPAAIASIVLFLNQSFRQALIDYPLVICVSSVLLRLTFRRPNASLPSSESPTSNQHR